MAVRGRGYGTALSYHADFRWWIRTQQDDVGPLEAWHQGRWIPGAERYVAGGEVRWFPPLDVALVRRGPAIATVLTRDYEQSPELWRHIDEEASDQLTAAMEADLS